MQEFLGFGPPLEAPGRYERILLDQQQQQQQQQQGRRPAPDLPPDIDSLDPKSYAKAFDEWFSRKREQQVEDLKNRQDEEVLSIAKYYVLFAVAVILIGTLTST